MKNILFVFTCYPAIGGIEIVSTNLFEYLCENFNIYVLSITCQADVPVPAEIKKIEHFGIESTHEQRAEIFNRFVAQNQIDCVINQGMSYVANNVILNDRRDKSVKLFSFLHGLPKYEERYYWDIKMSKAKYRKRKLLHCLGLNGGYNIYVRRFAKSYRQVAELGDKIVLLCDGFVDDFVTKYKVEKYRDKVIAIENPLSRKFSMQGEVPWVEKKNQVIYMGRLSKEKRVQIIVDVWQKAALSDEWELVIVGDGDEREMLERTVANDNIPNVRFVGRTMAVQDFYREAKIIMLTSSIEGFPMSLIEGQRFGVVPLVFDISAGVNSIVDDGGGVSVPMDDKCALIEQLRRLTSDEELLAELSAKARKKSDRYIIQNIGQRWNELLELES